MDSVTGTAADVQPVQNMTLLLNAIEAGHSPPEHLPLPLSVSVPVSREDDHHQQQTVTNVTSADLFPTLDNLYDDSEFEALTRFPHTTSPGEAGPTMMDSLVAAVDSVGQAENLAWNASASGGPHTMGEDDFDQSNIPSQFNMADLEAIPDDEVPRNIPIAQGSKRKIVSRQQGGEGEGEEGEREELGQREIKVRRISDASIGASSARNGPERNIATTDTLVTTVMCYHAAFAQKSYAQEKRFLCPPPMVRIAGPLHHALHKPQVSMAVVKHDGSHILDQDAHLSEGSSSAYFRSLHINGTAKDKSFRLQVSLHHPSPPADTSSLDDPDAMSKPATAMTNTHHDNNLHHPLSPPFATFESDPISIISKPSKKTEKARNMTSCVFNGSIISLFNRIHSQTVRTKYMCVEGGQICPRTGQWSPFMVQVVRPAEFLGSPQSGGSDVPRRTVANSNAPGAREVVTYGSTIRLRDMLTGVTSPDLVICKVEKDKVMEDAVGPVSQMQKLVLRRVTGDGRRVYFCASGDGFDEMGTKVDVCENVGEYQGEVPGGNTDGPHGSKSDVGGGCPAECPFGYTSGVETFTPASANVACSYKLASGRPDQMAASEGVLDLVDDFLTWTVIGISSFSYSFFDSFNLNPSLPLFPIMPFPVVYKTPCYAPAPDHTIKLSVKDFIHADAFTGHATAMEVWLGPLGPLNVEVSPCKPSAAEVAFANLKVTGKLDAGKLALAGGGIVSDGASLAPSSSSSSSSDSRVELLVHLPPTEEILGTISTLLEPQDFSDHATAMEFNDGMMHGGVHGNLVGGSGVEAKPSISVLGDAGAAADFSEDQLRRRASAASLGGSTERSDVDRFHHNRSPVSSTTSVSTQAHSDKVPTLWRVTQSRVTPGSASGSGSGSLPLIFVRPSDGIGYISACELVVRDVGRNSGLGMGMGHTCTFEAVNNVGSRPVTADSNANERQRGGVTWSSAARGGRAEEGGGGGGRARNGSWSSTSSSGTGASTSCCVGLGTVGGGSDGDFEGTTGMGGDAGMDDRPGGGGGGFWDFVGKVS